MKQHFLGKIYKDKLIERSNKLKSVIKGIFIKIPFNIEVYKIIRLNAKGLPLKNHFGLCTLIIPRGTKVYITHDKCRAAKAYIQKINVLEKNTKPFSYKITNILESDGYSDFDFTFKYKIKEIIIPDEFSQDQDPCSNGIHFFLTKEKAIDYLFWI